MYMQYEQYHKLIQQANNPYVTDSDTVLVLDLESRANLRSACIQQGVGSSLRSWEHLAQNSQTAVSSLQPL